MTKVQLTVDASPLLLRALAHRRGGRSAMKATAAELRTFAHGILDATFPGLIDEYRQHLERGGVLCPECGTEGSHHAGKLRGSMPGRFQFACIHCHHVWQGVRPVAEGKS